MIYPVILIIICWSFIMFVFVTAIPFIFRSDNDPVDIRSMDQSSVILFRSISDAD